MQKFTVVFAHGRESGPWGIKIRTLAKVAEQKGCRVLSRDDTDTMDPEVRVKRMIDEAKALDGPLVFVGSSMGGYVAAVAAKTVQPQGLFLMAPALQMPGYAVQDVSLNIEEITIVHGWGDDVVPLEPVQRFARKHRAMLHIVPAAHALLEQVESVALLFDIFLERCLKEKSTGAKERLAAIL